MWYEILPPVIIIAAAIGLCPLVSMPANWLILGNKYRRDIGEREGFYHYLRDFSRFGSPYSVTGLENIPDEPCKCKST